MCADSRGTDRSAALAQDEVGIDRRLRDEGHPIESRGYSVGRTVIKRNASFGIHSGPSRGHRTLAVGVGCPNTGHSPTAWRTGKIDPKRAFPCFPRVHRADLDGRLGGKGAYSGRFNGNPRNVRSWTHSFRTGTERGRASSTKSGSKRSRTGWV